MSNVPPANDYPETPYSPPAPATPAIPPQAPASESDATGGLIPYKNPKGLAAYYLGICGLFPLLGFPFGVAALVLGIMGLKARKANPVIRGHIHAWIGILCGVFSIGLTLLIVAGIVIAAIAG